MRELYHHGIKGQKWGIRRFQNEDGTLTEEGKTKYVNSLKKKIERTKNPEKKASYEKELSDFNREQITEGAKKAAKTMGKISGITTAAVASLAITAVGAGIVTGIVAGKSMDRTFDRQHAEWLRQVSR